MFCFSFFFFMFSFIVLFILLYYLFSSEINTVKLFINFHLLCRAFVAFFLFFFSYFFLWRSRLNAEKCSCIVFVFWIFPEFGGKTLENPNKILNKVKDEKSIINECIPIQPNIHTHETINKFNIQQHHVILKTISLIIQSAYKIITVNPGY